ncbi:MAG TPA: hypothetical protein VKD71_02260 [Gemmataceae bacterium]|nr:hypothetical protein [Gemmataceae bacterium]
MRSASTLTMLACVLLSGCSGSNVVPVSGTVTYKGQPVPNAYVHFVPQTGRPSLGETDANGKFTLSYDPETKGAELGKHRVFMQYNALADNSRPGVIPGETPPLANEWKEFFSKYGPDKSTLSIEISKSTSDLKLELD